MKILIVSTFFPPSNSIASLRPYSWAKYWSKMGHEVTVLTTKKEKSVSDLNLDCSMFNVIEIPYYIPLRKSYHDVKNIIKQNKQLTLKQMLINSMRKVYDKFTRKTGVLYACRYPDWLDIWAKHAIQHIKNDNVDIIISTGWPYSVHRIGYYLKSNGLAKKWILDWRDLWTKNHLYKGLPIFYPIEKYLENKFHNTADLITTVSEPLAEVLRNMTKTPVATIYNGFDPEDYENLLNKTRKKNERLEIVYTGTIYKNFRDPTPLLQAIKELLENKSINKNDLHITFAGNHADISELISRFNLNEIYTYLGFLPREKALELQYDADILLFLEYENPEVKGVLTGKLFEYLYIAREIWAIGCSNKTETGALIETSNSGIAFGKDKEKIKKYIINKLKNKNVDKFKNKNLQIIEYYNRKKQAEKMLELISLT